MKGERPDLLVGPQPLPAIQFHGDHASLRVDSWSNALSGLGTSRDKRTSMVNAAGTAIDKTAALALWMSDGIVRRIINSIAEDMFREWGYFQNDPTDYFDEGIMQNTCTMLNARAKFQEAKIAARSTGGALIFVGVSGAGAPQSELNPARIKTFDFLKVFDLGNINTTSSIWDTNPNSPTFGQILLYKVKVKVGSTTVDLDLHASRCLPFFGATVPPSLTGTADDVAASYWGIPEMQHIYDDLKDFRSVFANVSNIMSELVIGKYTITNLEQILASPDAPALLKVRLNAMSDSKSLINAVLLGEGESYERDNISLSSVPETMDRYMIVLSGVSGYPVTKLFGRSAAGLNATGDGDKDNYYDRVKSEQNALDPTVQKFANMLAAAFGVTDDHSFIFNSIYQQTPAQKAEATRVMSEAFARVMDGLSKGFDMGAIQPEWVLPIIQSQFPEMDIQTDAGGMPVGISPKKATAPAGKQQRKKGTTPSRAMAEAIVKSPKGQGK